MYMLGFILVSVCGLLLILTLYCFITQKVRAVLLSSASHVL